jgi:hypothetical protein
MGRYGLLLICALASLALQGVAPPSDLQQVAVTALGAAAVVLALRAAPLSRRVIAVATAFALVVLALSVMRALFGVIGEGAVRAMNAALVAIGPPAIAYGVVHDLRTTGHVRLQSVMAVLSFYVLVGMLFAFVYGAIDRFGNEPFFAGGQEATTSHCLYFSFITLTTVGYGDFVAQTDLGHTLALFEALIGQIYLVTVVSLIVTNLRRPSSLAAGPSARQP